MTIDDCIRDVVGYEGKYKINIVGEVFNKKGRQLKPCVDKFGYLKCCLYDGKPHQKKIHRMVAEPSEIHPLVCITEDEPLVTWKNGKVLMLTLHKYPDFYTEGKDVTFTFGNSWTFTDREMEEWYKKNGQNVTDWSFRLKQLLGITPEQNQSESPSRAEPSNVSFVSCFDASG